MSKRGRNGFDYRPTAHSLGLALALAVLWLLLSGHYQPLILAFGAGSVLFCVFIALRMDLADSEGVPLQIGWRPTFYLPWLALEIVKANIDVAKRVMQPIPDLSPELFETPASQKTDLGQVIYANSITLTPGTVSVDLDPGVIRVHALSREGADEIRKGEMDRRARAVEGG